VDIRLALGIWETTTLSVSHVHPKEQDFFVYFKEVLSGVMHTVYFTDHEAHSNIHVVYVTLLWALPNPHSLLAVGSAQDSSHLVSNCKESHDLDCHFEF